MTAEDLYDKLFPKTLRQRIIEFIAPKARVPYYVSKLFATTNEHEERMFDVYIRVFDWPDYNPPERQNRFLIVANVEVAMEFRQKGIFNKVLVFLEQENPYSGLLFECVQNEFLKAALIRKGYIQLTCVKDSRPNFYKPSKKNPCPLPFC